MMSCGVVVSSVSGLMPLWGGGDVDVGPHAVRPTTTVAKPCTQGMQTLLQLEVATCQAVRNFPFLKLSHIQG